MTTTTIKSLSVKEALEQGYEYAGDPSKDYQCFIPINDLGEEDFKRHKWVLASIETYVPSITAKSIAEILAEHMESDVGNDTGDDTEEVYHTILKLDFESTARIINEALKNRWYRTLTKITLLP